MFTTERDIKKSKRSSLSWYQNADKHEARRLPFCWANLLMALSTLTSFCLHICKIAKRMKVAHVSSYCVLKAHAEIG